MLNADLAIEAADLHVIHRDEDAASEYYAIIAEAVIEGSAAVTLRVPDSSEAPSVESIAPNAHAAQAIYELLSLDDRMESVRDIPARIAVASATAAAVSGRQRMSFFSKRAASMLSSEDVVQELDASSDDYCFVVHADRDLSDLLEGRKAKRRAGGLLPSREHFEGTPMNLEYAKAALPSSSLAQLAEWLPGRRFSVVSEPIAFRVVSEDAFPMSVFYDAIMGRPLTSFVFALPEVSSPSGELSVMAIFEYGCVKEVGVAEVREERVSVSFDQLYDLLDPWMPLETSGDEKVVAEFVSAGILVLVSVEK